MTTNWDRYQEALKNVAHDCAHLGFCADCMDLYRLIAKLKREGFIECSSCGELAKSETDYCRKCEPCSV